MFDSKKTVDKLKHENAVLKNRCRVYTSGMLCVICNLDCPNRAAAFQDKETLETLLELKKMEKRKISKEIEFFENRDRKKIIIAKRKVPRLSKTFLRPIYQYTKMECGDHAKIGDTIKCLDPNEMIDYVRTLRKEGYKINVDLRECLITIRRTPEDPENE